MKNLTLALVLCAFGLLACKKEETKPADPASKAAPPTVPAPEGGDKAGTPGPGDPNDPLAAPPDVAAPPADAQKTPSGLASKVLKPGTGADKPTPNDEVTVHYTGWTTDGKMFDSSVKRGQPATFPLQGVIAGWTEGVPLMVVGEKRRFWIPVELAYKNAPGKPAGMLVFDIELVSFKAGPKPVPAPEDCKNPPGDAGKSASGLQWKVLTPGTGTDKPGIDDVATLQIEGWTQADGKLFNSTKRDNRSAKFKIGDVPIKGFQEVIPMMTKGEKRRVWLPEALAFAGRPGAPAGALCLDMELVEWKVGPKPAPAPSDVKAPPADAQKAPSGLAWKVLQKGKGTDHPKATSTVEVHYTGWTTDGKMFDSSVARGEPAQFPLNGVIKGWTEGVQLMVEGDKRRFWIPVEMAYNNQPGKPAGMLVFDVELLKIVKP